MLKRLPTNDPLYDDALAAAGVTEFPLVRIQKRDGEKQIVYGVVYAPGEVDTHGEVMFAPAIEEMCHNFTRLMMSKGGSVIDMEHDNKPLSAYPVESYIETAEGRDWPAGSWVMAVKIEDPEIWSMVKAGTLNGFSFEAMVTKLAAVVGVDLMPDAMGVTDEVEGHNHAYFIEFDENGRVCGGQTSMDAGHRHNIRSGTATEAASIGSIPTHSHRLLVN